MLSHFKLYSFLLLLLLFFFMAGCSSPPVDRVVVKKSEAKMYLQKRGKVVKSYNISLGGNPVGHKIQQGDSRTPEGVYSLNYKNSKSRFYKSINIDYPNEADIVRAKSRGLDPGDDIVIHGMPNELGDVRGPIEPLNWTEGCIAVRNYEMDEIWSLVALDTPIEILP